VWVAIKSSIFLACAAHNVVEVTGNQSSGYLHFIDPSLGRFPDPDCCEGSGRDHLCEINSHNLTDCHFPDNNAIVNNLFGIANDAECGI
jgi:hypothetical protein